MSILLMTLVLAPLAAPVAAQGMRFTTTGDASGSDIMTVKSQQITSAIQPVVIATKTVDQSIGQSIATNILFQSNVKLANITHTASGSSTFTFTSSGTYLVVCSLQFDTSSVGTRQITMVVNNTTTIANIKTPAAASGLSPMQAVAVWTFNVSDFVVCRGTQDSGAPLNVRGGVSPATNFVATRLWSPN